MAQTCKKCNQDKDLEDFRSTGGYTRTSCRECENTASKEWSRANPEKRKASRDKRWASGRLKEQNWKYKGIIFTMAEYNQTFADQKGCCKICGIHQSELKKALCVDHDHNTMEIRGLLCDPCNTGLGLLGDNTEGLLSALRYLEDGTNDD